MTNAMQILQAHRIETVAPPRPHGLLCRTCRVRAGLAERGRRWV